MAIVTTLATATVTALAAALLAVPTAHADTPGPYFATSGLSSDHHACRARELRGRSCRTPEDHVHPCSVVGIDGVEVEVGHWPTLPDRDWPVGLHRMWHPSGQLEEEQVVATAGSKPACVVLSGAATVAETDTQKG